MKILVALFVAGALAGCPERTPANGDAGAKTAAACATFGQTCEYSPGKLGSCVTVDDCSTPPCLVCQSQH